MADLRVSLFIVRYNHFSKPIGTWKNSHLILENLIFTLLTGFSHVLSVFNPVLECFKVLIRVPHKYMPVWAIGGFSDDPLSTLISRFFNFNYTILL